MTVTEFLTARLDEDEAVAREVLGSHDPLPPWVPGDFDDPSAWQMGAGEGPSGYISVIIDAARVLAEVAAKRNLIQLHRQDGDAPWCMEGCGMRAGGPEWPCDTLYRMASVYSDHPDYRDEWKP